MADVQQMIEKVYAAPESLLSPVEKAELQSALTQVISDLDQGKIRVAEKIKGNWVVHQWIKKAILLYFKYQNNQTIDGSFCQFYDKIPLKFQDKVAADYQDLGLRIVPPAIARQGAFIGKRCILMPSYVNIGAYIDEGTMIDTWATVGSCAQIGKNVHISGGVGIGGVLEPLQSNPTIIEDNCFIGARSEVVEGVIVEENSVLSMGVFLGQSTKIYNRLTKTISYGRIPAGSVVVPGSLPSQDGSHQLYCAVIVKEIDAKTRAKVSINALLRDSQ